MPALEVTVAVKVTVWPAAEGLGAEDRDVEVLAGNTVTVTSPETPAA